MALDKEKLYSQTQVNLRLDQDQSYGLTSLAPTKCALGCSVTAVGQDFSFMPHPIRHLVSPDREMSSESEGNQ